MLRIPKLNCSNGFSLIETMIGLLLTAILITVVGRFQNNFLRESKGASASVGVELLIRDFGRALDGEISPIIVNPPITRAEWAPPTPDPFPAGVPDPKFSFSGKFLENFDTCGKLQLRYRYVNPTSIVTWGITELKTECGNAMSYSEAEFDSMLIDGDCPSSSPRPVFTISHWLDETDFPAGDPDWRKVFPAAYDINKTELNQHTSMPISMQACFSFDPPYDSIGDPEWDIEETPLTNLIINIAVAYITKDDMKIYRQTLSDLSKWHLSPETALSFPGPRRVPLKILEVSKLPPNNCASCNLVTRLESNEPGRTSLVHSHGLFDKAPEAKEANQYNQVREPTETNWQRSQMIQTTSLVHSHGLFDKAPEAKEANQYIRYGSRLRRTGNTVK